VLELPYGEQSVLIYDDFDFDGRRDLALMDGQNSCYGGPSFQIFLRQGSGFVRSKAFTKLAQEFCGMFSVDPVAQRIATMTKSGCCWHEFNVYTVVNHEPRLLETTVEAVAEFSSAYFRTERTG